MVTRTHPSHGAPTQGDLDTDTAVHGTEPPFQPWESDHTALVHVLWAAEHDGLLATRPDAGLPLERALFDRLFAPEHRGRAGVRDRLIADLRTILDAHDPHVTPGAPGTGRVAADSLTPEEQHESGADDRVASMILRSRWLAAVKAAARGQRDG